MSPRVRAVGVTVLAVAWVAYFAVKRLAPAPPPPPSPAGTRVDTGSGAAAGAGAGPGAGSAAETAPRGTGPVAIGARLRAERLEARFEVLRPLHAPLGEPREGEWLFSQEEDGQSFAQYTASYPVRATPGRRTIYLLPLGDFTEPQRRVVAQTADFIARFYQLPVKTLEPLPASAVPFTARRKNPHDGHSQLLTTWVLNEALKPRRPDDALAVLGLTAEDLYPDPAWNFVFGQASLGERVGVWSLARNGDLEKEPALFLSRTLKTAVHELGHMVSMQHCLAWRCVLNGSNSLQESDVQPLELCPACLQKLTWSVGLEPAKRFEALLAYEVDAGLVDDAALLRRALDAFAASRGGDGGDRAAGADPRNRGASPFTPSGTK